jgi:hypothetical protein
MRDLKLLGLGILRRDAAELQRGVDNGASPFSSYLLMFFSLDACFLFIRAPRGLGHGTAGRGRHLPRDVCTLSVSFCASSCLCLLPSLRRDYVDERRDVLATDAAELQHKTARLANKTARLAKRDREKANNQAEQQEKTARLAERKACSALEEEKKCDKE